MTDERVSTTRRAPAVAAPVATMSASFLLNPELAENLKNSAVRLRVCEEIILCAGLSIIATRLTGRDEIQVASQDAMGSLRCEHTVQINREERVAHFIQRLNRAFRITNVDPGCVSANNRRAEHSREDRRWISVDAIQQWCRVSEDESLSKEILADREKSPPRFCDIEVEYRESTQGCECILSYSITSFAGIAVQQWSGYFTTALSVMLNDSSTRVLRVPLLSIEECEQIVSSFNPPVVAYRLIC
jgi:hypothetical protein